MPVSDHPEAFGTTAAVMPVAAWVKTTLPSALRKPLPLISIGRPTGLEGLVELLISKIEGTGGWLVFGGTSVSSPSLAGIVNLANHFYGGSNTELSAIYADYVSPSYSTDFRDITSGLESTLRAQRSRQSGECAPSPNPLRQGLASAVG